MNRMRIIHSVVDILRFCETFNAWNDEGWKAAGNEPSDSVVLPLSKQVEANENSELQLLTRSYLEHPVGLTGANKCQGRYHLQVTLTPSL